MTVYDPEFHRGDLPYPLDAVRAFVANDDVSWPALRVATGIALARHPRTLSELLERGGPEAHDEIRAGCRELIAHGYLVPDGYTVDGQLRYKLDAKLWPVVEEGA